MDFSIHLPKKDSLKMDENWVKIYSLWVEEGILLYLIIFTFCLKQVIFKPIS